VGRWDNLDGGGKKPDAGRGHPMTAATTADLEGDLEEVVGIEYYSIFMPRS
jgi:hypothetical protein